MESFKGKNVLGRREFLGGLSSAAALVLAGGATRNAFAETLSDREDRELDRWELESPEGRIFHWYPEEYKNELDSIVVFIHGSHVEKVKDCWEELELERQFRESGKKALFIVPKTAKNGHERVRWKKNLGGLIDHVKAQTNLNPPNDVTVIAHSHGYRTLATWLDFEPLNNIILSDSLYQHINPFAEWASRDGNRIILIAPKKDEMPRSTEHNVKKLINRCKRRYGKDSLYVDGVPEEFDDELIENTPDIIHISSQYRHSQIPRSKRVYPAVLQLTGRSG